MAVLQSLAQARHRWGEHAADAIWDAATVKVVLGGLAQRRDLDDVTRLAGEIDEPIPTHTRGRRGERSSSTSLRQVPVLPPERSCGPCRSGPPSSCCGTPHPPSSPCNPGRRDPTPPSSPPTGPVSRSRSAGGRREGPPRPRRAPRRGDVPARRRPPRGRRRRRHRPRLHTHRRRGRGCRAGRVRARPRPGQGLDRADPHRLPRPAHPVDRRRHGPGILVPARRVGRGPQRRHPRTVPAQRRRLARRVRRQLGRRPRPQRHPRQLRPATSTPPPSVATSAPGWTASAASAPPTPTGPSSSSCSDLDALVIAHNAGEAWLPRYPRLPDVTEAFLMRLRLRPSRGVAGLWG